MQPDAGFASCRLRWTSCCDARRPPALSRIGVPSRIPTQRPAADDQRPASVEDTEADDPPNFAALSGDPGGASGVRRQRRGRNPSARNRAGLERLRCRNRGANCARASFHSRVARHARRDGPRRDRHHQARVAGRVRPYARSPRRPHSALARQDDDSGCVPRDAAGQAAAPQRAWTAPGGRARAARRRSSSRSPHAGDPHDADQDRDGDLRHRARDRIPTPRARARVQPERQPEDRRSGGCRDAARTSAAGRGGQGVSLAHEFVLALRGSARWSRCRARVADVEPQHPAGLRDHRRAPCRSHRAGIDRTHPRESSPHARARRERRAPTARRPRDAATKCDRPIRCRPGPRCSS